MAKTKETTIAQRSNVILLHNQGNSYSKISEILKIPKPTIQCIITRYKSTNSLENKEGRGRKKILNEADRKYLVRLARKDPFQTSQQLTDSMTEMSGKSMNRITIIRELKASGIHSRTPSKKPFISEVNRKKRLAYAKKYIDMPISFWRKIIWTDESKFNVKGNDGRERVFRKQGERLKLQLMKGTVKHGGGSAMLWGSMNYKGVGFFEFIETTMNKEHYKLILERNLVKTARKFRMGSNWILLHDNDPKHTSKYVCEYLENQGVQVQDHPPQSPDLNVIEHLWDEIGRKLIHMKIKNVKQLKLIIPDLWDQIGPEVTAKLVDSMPKRLAEVIKNKGGLHIDLSTMLLFHSF